MRQDVLWFGYLDAGGSSSPVVRDDTLSTGDPDTLYLFNFARQAFREYKRTLVEPKLRELAPAEIPFKELQAAYMAARSNFMPRGQVLHLAEVASSGPQARDEGPPPRDELEEFIGRAVDAEPEDSDDDDDALDED